MKRLAHSAKWFVLIAFCVVASMMASDIDRGITFSTTEHITNVKLHNLVDLSTIDTSFYSGKSSAQPGASDVFLFLQPGTPIYRKTTYATLLLSATNLITSQAENDLPVTNDYVLSFQTAAGSLAKVPFISIFTNEAGILTGLPDYTNWPSGGFSYWYGYQGNGGRIEHSNVFLGWWQWEPFSTNVAASNPLTNPPVASLIAPSTTTNANMLQEWDAKNQTNKFVTLAGFLTNAPPVPEGALTNVDNLLVFSRATNAFVTSSATGIVAQVSLTNLAHYVAQKYTASGIAIPTGASITGTTNNHGLAGLPQFWSVSIVNVTPELGYVAGDEVSIKDAAQSAIWIGVNSSNIWFTYENNNPWAVSRRDTGQALQSITKANWAIKFDAIYFP